VTSMELEKRVRETVGKLLTDDELTGFELSKQPPKSWQFPNEHELWLILDVRGEAFVLPLIPDAGPGYYHETLDELCDRVYSSLQDWVAESKFARGQQR